MKPGYKQTEVGVIPADWDACPLPEIVWFQEGPGLRKWQFRSGGLKVINVTNLQENGYLDLSKTERHISWEEFERTYKHFLIDDGDIVMASSGNSYCKTAVVRQGDLPLLMNTSVIRFKAKEHVDGSFILIYLKSKYFKDQIDLMITGGAQPNFGPAHLVKVLIPLPPTKAEQEAIAEALSDADALIESLEQLLTKKRQIKQGAMQELLTGKKRLPGFGGQWEVKRLGEVLQFQVGFPFSSVYFNEAEQGVRLVKNRDLKNDDQVIYYSGGFAQEFLVRDGDVLIGMDGDFLPCMWAKGSALLNQRVGRIVAHTSLDLAFAFYYLLAPLKEIESATSGTTVKHLSHGDIEGIEKPLPTLPEQRAIATILSDMDTEIAALEAKHSKARQIKQGMMQELLTGRIRLI